MIEHDRDRQIVFPYRPRNSRVVGALWNTSGGGDENRRHSMMARIPCRIGISVKLIGQKDIQRSFLFSFSDSSAFDTLAVVDESSRQGPSVRRIFSFDQNNAADGEFDNDIDSQ